MDAENKILLKQVEIGDLPRLIMEGVGIDQQKTLALTVERWGNFFLLFQDFLGNVNDLIAQNGGDLAQYQARAQTLLSPQRQLRTFIREVVDSTPFEHASEEVEGMLIDAIVAFAREKIFEPELITRVQAAAIKGNVSLDAVQPLTDYIQSMMRGETISKQWAEYYVNLPGNVINAIPGNFVDRSAVVQDDESSTEHRAPSTNSMMFLLQQFEKLPDEAKKHFTSDAVRLQREETEKKHGIDLEELVLQAAAKEFPLSELAIRIKKEFDLSPEIASQVRDEIVLKIFSPVEKYYREEIGGQIQDSGFKIQEQNIETQEQETREKIQDSGFKIQEKNGRPEVPNTELPAPSTAIIHGSPLMQDDYTIIANAIISQSGILIDSGAKDRLEKMIVTRIRNIRNLVATRERMIEGAATGGAGLSSDSADVLLKLANRAADMITAGDFDGVRASFPAAQEKIQDSGFKIQEKSANSAPKLTIEEVDGLPVFTETQGGQIQDSGFKIQERNTEAQNAGQIQDLGFKIQEKSGGTKNTEAKAPSTPPPANHPIGKDAHQIPVTVRATSSLPAGNTQVTDIKTPPRLIDGVEELRIMTVKDFRRISADPQEATKRIMQKVSLLEKESMSKKMEGIQAWKESDVSKLYMDMAQESFGKGLPMQQVVAQRAAEGKEALTEQEFDALVDLNESLRV